MKSAHDIEDKSKINVERVQSDTHRQGDAVSVSKASQDTKDMAKNSSLDVGQSATADRVQSYSVSAIKPTEDIEEMTKNCILKLQQRENNVFKIKSTEDINDKAKYSCLKVGQSAKVERVERQADLKVLRIRDDGLHKITGNCLKNYIEMCGNSSKNHPEKGCELKNNCTYKRDGRQKEEQNNERLTEFSEPKNSETQGGNDLNVNDHTSTKKVDDPKVDDLLSHTEVCTKDSKLSTEERNKTDKQNKLFVPKRDSCLSTDKPSISYKHRQINQDNATTSNEMFEDSRDSEISPLDVARPVLVF